MMEYNVPRYITQRVIVVQRGFAELTHGAESMLTRDLAIRAGKVESGE